MLKIEMITVFLVAALKIIEKLFSKFPKIIFLQFFYPIFLQF